MKLVISETTPEDIPHIQEFLTSDTALWFGQSFSLAELIEKSYICLSHKHSIEAVSIITLNDYPPVASIPMNSWLAWTKEIYHCSYLRYQNTLFIHFLSWSPTCEGTVLQELLSYIYEHYYRIDYIILVIPKHVQVHESMHQHFLPMKKLSQFEETKFSLPFYVNSRSRTVSPIEIRVAEIEHADYIMDILVQKQPDARSTYAIEMMNELHEHADSEYRKRLVALKDDKVVAFMILDTRVDLELLKENFHLHLYTKPSTSDHIPPNKSMSSTSDQVENALSGQEESDEDVEKSSLTSKAFAVAVFAVESDHEYVVPFFLKAAFRTYCPDCDLCVTSTKSDHTSPLFKFMNQVLLKENTLYPSELYALSKYAVLGIPTVRPSTLKDLRQISWLLEYYEEKEKILQDVIEYLNDPDDDPKFKMVTICIDTHNIIGFALLCCEVDNQTMESHFCIHQVCNYSAYHHYDQAFIKYFIFSLPFLKQGRYIVKELLRLLDVSCLLYYQDVTTHTKTIPEIVRLMVPVRPRVLTQYPPSTLNGNIPSEWILKENPPAALYMLSKKITSMVHANNHVRALVVGASPVGLSLLESFIYDRTPAEPCFTRINLVTKHGLWQKPHKYQHLTECIMVTDGYMRWHYVASMGLSMWVTLRVGVVTEINVNEKYITTNYGEHKQNYEYLFLVIQLDPSLDSLQMTMQQKQKTVGNGLKSRPCDTNITRQEAFEKFTHEAKHISHGQCEASLKAFGGTVEADFLSIENVFYIANIVNAGRGLDYVEELIKKKQEPAPILIIGNCLGATACVHAILSLGSRKAGFEVTLIEQLNEEKTNSRFSMQNNKDVTRALIQELNEQKVSYVFEVKIYDYDRSSQHVNKSMGPGRVTWITFQSSDNVLFTLQCSAVFVFQPAFLEKHLYNALIAANVLVERQILVNANYQTSHPSIYAAGTSTKFLDRYYAEDKKFTSSSETGQDLSKKFRNFLNRNLQHDTDVLSESSQCIVEKSILPGGYNYLHVYKPGKRPNYEYAKPGDYYNVTTGKISKHYAPGYFHIVFNKHKIVEEIICARRAPLYVGNTVQLYGKHAGLLNNILEHHAVDPIPDLFQFFEQAWCMAIYHDKFNAFLKSVSTLFHVSSREKTSLLDIVKEMKNSSSSEEDAKSKIREAFMTFEIQKKNLSREKLQDMLVQRVIEFLEMDTEYLPMYATRWAMEKTFPAIQQKNLRGGDKDRDPCCRQGLPERGYHVPYTEPMVQEDLVCIPTGENAFSERSNSSQREASVSFKPSSNIEEVALVLLRKKNEICEGDLIKSLKEKKIQLRDGE